MNKHTRSIVVSLFLFIGLAVTGIAVQRSQDTRRKAAGNIVYDKEVLLTSKVTSEVESGGTKVIGFFIDLYASSSEAKMEYFNIKFDYFGNYKAESVKGSASDCYGNSVNTREKGNGIYEANFSGNCGNKTGTIHLGRIHIKNNGDIIGGDLSKMYVFFHEEIGTMFSNYGNYKLIWAPGYSGIIDSYGGQPRDGVVENKLIQMSYKISKTGEGGDEKYTFDVYADTLNKDIYLMDLRGHVNFSKSLDLVEQPGMDYCKAWLFGKDDRYGNIPNTFQSNFVAKCNGKKIDDMPTGKVHIARFVFKANTLNVNHSFIFKGININYATSDTGSIYPGGGKAQWVSGYSNIVDLDQNNIVTPIPSGGYKCYARAKEPGPSFKSLIVGDTDNLVSWQVGTTFMVDVGIKDFVVGQKVNGLDISLLYDTKLFKMLNVINLNNDTIVYNSGKTGVAIMPKDLGTAILLSNNYLVRLVFKIENKISKRWALRFACIQDSVADSNIIVNENEAVRDIISCEDNQILYADDSGGNYLKDNNYIWLKEPKDWHKLTDDSRCDKYFRPGYECWEDKQHGDYNKDGVTNGGDYVRWRNEFLDKKVSEGFESDGNCDGRSSVADYSLWRQEYLTVPSEGFEIPKTDKPELAFYVMSFCPYGNQMEGILRSVFDLIGTKANIQPHYIFEKITNIADNCKQRSGDVNKCKDYVANKYFPTEAECIKVITGNYNTCSDPNNYIVSGSNYYSSFHGRMEAAESVREICAYNLATDKKLWWDFVGNVNKNCDSKNADTCWEEQAKKAGLDTAKITECFNKDGIKLIEDEIALTDKNKIQASPTILVNGVEFPPQNAYTMDGKGSITLNGIVIPQKEFRTPNTQKEAVCAGFNKAPDECKTKIETIEGSDIGACSVVKLTAKYIID